MSEEQKELIIEAVEQTAAGLFTGSELLSKLERLTGEKFGTEADLGLVA
jgi:hypothetical protein